jgi:eukaryotic-like serine/threonine-protein kinase
MSSIACQQCGVQNSDFNVRCSACGATLPAESELGLARTQSVPPQEPTVESPSEPSDPVWAETGLPPVTRLGEYRLLSRLGHGGMGVVYRAVHEPSGRAVALKTVRLPKHQLLPRIRREIHALARIRHSGIVRILEHGVFEGLPWYAMELLEGSTLRRLVPRTAADRTAEARALRLAIVRQLSQALAYLHGEGLVHRDLKPENVLLRREEPEARSEGRAAQAATSLFTPVLVDFGLVSDFTARLARESLSVEVGSVGTLRYAAPEQVRGELLDARADLYSLGCMLYELLTGAPPFAAASARELVLAHLRQTPRPPSELAPELPEALDALVLRLLAKEPRDRIGHAGTVDEVLGALGFGEAPGPDEPRPRAYLYRPGISGRTHVLSELEGHLERLERGGRGLVLVGGESGVGKTRLAMELGQRAARGGLQVLEGECAAPSSEQARGGAALHPLRRTLQRVADRCRTGGASETERLLGRRGPLLAQYEPALARLPGQEPIPEPPPLPVEEARLRLYSYLNETLAALTHAAPALLLLDDLQWSDELTLGWLELLLRGGPPERMPLLVVGTYRTEEVGSGQASPLERLLEAPGAHRLLLQRLEPAAVGSMVSDMLALSGPPEPFVRYLATQSEGNPFFVGEYLRAAVAEKVLDRDEQGRWRVAGAGTGPALPGQYELPLPGTVRELVGRRLDGLAPEAARLAEAAAVLGREVDASLLARVLGAPEEALLEALRELLARQVLEEAEAGRLRFLHDKIRELAHERIEPARRQELHRAAAEAFESLESREEHLAALGQHWEGAGVPDKARVWFLAAVRQAVSRYAHAEAERHYRAWLRLAGAPGHDEILLRLELVEQVLETLGRFPEALAEVRLAHEIAQELGDGPLVSSCTRALGRLHHRLGRMDEARELLERALELHRACEDRRGEALALNNLANIHREQGRLPLARALYEQSLEQCRTLGFKQLEARNLGNLAIALNEEGRPEEAIASYEQVLVLFRHLGLRLEEGITLSNLATPLNRLGRFEQAARALGQALELAREIGDRVGEGMVLDQLGTIELMRGRACLAQERFEQANELYRLGGDRQSEAAATWSLGLAQHEQGQIDRARTTLERAIGLYRDFGRKRFEGAALCNLARLERHASPDVALRAGPLLDRSEALLREVGDPLYLALCLCERGHLELAAGRSARPQLGHALALAGGAEPDPSSELGQAWFRLRHAVEAFEAGEALVRGEWLADLSEGLRCWLQQTDPQPAA